MAINAAIYRAAGFPSGEVAELDFTNYGLPREMLELRLDSLLRLILFVESIREKDRQRRKQRPFAATDLAVATEVGRAGVMVLRDWPSPLREVLRRMIPQEADEPAALNFKAIFGNFTVNFFASFRAANLDSFTMPSSGLSLRIGRGWSVVSIATFQLQRAGTPNGCLHTRRSGWRERGPAGYRTLSVMDKLKAYS